MKLPNVNENRRGQLVKLNNLRQSGLFFFFLMESKDGAATRMPFCLAISGTNKPWVSWVR